MRGSEGAVLTVMSGMALLPFLSVSQNSTAEAWPKGW